MNYTLIKKTLDNDTLLKYFGKIKIFKVFTPTILSANGKACIRYAPNKRKICDVDDIDSIKIEDKNTIQIGKDIKFESIDEAYMWHFTNEEEMKLDEIDKLLLKSNTKDLDDSFERHELYGLHTYGGYYGFFRPDMNEVINLVSSIVPIECIDEIDRIYVTTEPHPNSNVHNCFDYKQDRHRAQTTCYIYKSKKKQKSSDK